MSIAEIVPAPDGSDLALRDVYLFRRTGIQKETGRILGHYEYTGVVPAFIESLRAAGVTFDESMFSA